MAQAVTLNSKSSTPALVQELPCYTKLLERIASIWCTIYAWICDLASQLFSWTTNAESKCDLALRNQNCFCHMIRYLEPEEVARCERVAKSWKINKVWQAQCANYGVTVAPEGGRFKDLFTEIPEMAFGPSEWKKHFGKAGPTPPLPANIKDQVAKLGKTHTLTLIPKTVNGAPLCFNTFAPLAKKVGIRLYVDVGFLVSGWDTEKYGTEPVEKSFWVWMQKELEPASINREQAEIERDYPQKLGKALWIVISTVAHYALHKIFLFPVRTFTRTRDPTRDGAWYLTVGHSSDRILKVQDHVAFIEKLGLAACYPADLRYYNI